MESNPAIQLLTLWFVVLVFIQTSSGGGGAANLAIGMIAILLMYGIPIALVAHFGLQLADSLRA